MYRKNLAHHALLVLFFALVCPAAAAAQRERGFVDRVYQDDAGRHKYVVFVPHDYTPQKKWPIILFLHGTDERGSDGRRQLQVGLGPLVEAREKTFPFLVVFPQAKRREKQRYLTTWAPDAPDGRLAMAIFEQVENDYSVDRDREILTGWSMGGFGVWQLGAAYPDRWNALVPVSGGGDHVAVEKLSDTPVWAFHGAHDRVVLPKDSRRMVEALREAGGQARFTELPEAGHDAWKTAYASDALFQWMLDPVADNRAHVPLRVRPGVRLPREADTTAPFVPAVEIRRALFLRLGNQALKSLSYSIPDMLPADMLSGTIADMSDTTTAQSRTFWVTFTNIRYDADLARAYVQTGERQRLRIQLGLQNVRLTIGRTYVQGSSRSAVAGPISVVIGHRRPVWLTIDTEPYAERRKLRLRLARTWFDIPDDNWYVSQPRGVSTRGLGMTRERVSSGLVRGLYGSKSRIQREVRGVVPGMIDRLEKQLNEHWHTAKAQELATSFWPLPVYRPRVRLFPESVSTDEDGVSVLFGLTAAAVHPESAPEKPETIDAAPDGDVPGGRQLRVGMAAEALEPLTRLLIEADVARVHAAETPNDSFAPFTDYASLSSAVPDLAQYGKDVEIWAELILAEPLKIGGAADASEADLRIESPKILISTALRTDPNSQWQPYAEFEVSVAQDTRLVLQSPKFRKRVFQLRWAGEPDVRANGRFASGYTPKVPQLNLDRVAEMFRDGWTAWTGEGPAARGLIPDIDFGTSKLRAAEVRWSNPHIVAAFADAGIKVSNGSAQEFRYEVRGPRGDWGGPYRLEPGKSHRYNVPYSMLYRRRVDDRYRVFTLPAGSHSEFRAPATGGSPQLFQAR